MYQEAQKHFPIVSPEEAVQILQQSEEITKQNLEGASEDTIKLFEEIYAIENAVAQEFGYDSAEDRRKARIDDLAVSMTINKMRSIFDDELMRNNLDIQGMDLTIFLANRWEDYTEFLLKSTSIQQISYDYEIVFYGEKWENGALDFE